MLEKQKLYELQLLPISDNENDRNVDEKLHLRNNRHNGKFTADDFLATF